MLPGALLLHLATFALDVLQRRHQPDVEIGEREQRKYSDEDRVEQVTVDDTVGARLGHRRVLGAVDGRLEVQSGFGELGCVVDDREYEHDCQLLLRLLHGAETERLVGHAYGDVPVDTDQYRDPDGRRLKDEHEGQEVDQHDRVPVPVVALVESGVVDEKRNAVHREYGQEHQSVDDGQRLKEERRGCLELVAVENDEGSDVSDGPEHAEETDDDGVDDE